MRPGPERGHCDEVLPLLGGQTMESNQEEVLVELGLNSRRGALHVTRGNRARGCNVPDVVPPFLQEVRISMRPRDHDVQRVVVDRRATFLSRHRERGSGVGGLERADHRKVEQSLGVRLGLACESAQLRESRAGEDHREVELVRPVDRDDQRGELVRSEVLQLVDGEDDPGAAIARGLFLTERSVENVIHSIFLKLGIGFEQSVHKRVKAVILYLAEGD